MAEVHICEMKKNVFDLLDKCPNWMAAWKLCGKDAVAVFAGITYISIYMVQSSSLLSLILI